MDWNSDGKKDLIVGDTQGYLWIFLNTGTDANPVLAAGQKLLVNGKEFKPTGGRAKPWVADWNNDGKKDVVCGVENGEVWLLLNTGTDRAPAFAKATPLAADNKILKGGMRSCPVVYDWNHDGKKDLLCADEDGAVIFYENGGLDAEPRLRKGVPLQARGWPISAPSGGRVKADFNGDGEEETLYVRQDGTLQSYQGRTKPQSAEVDGQPFKVTGKVKASAAFWDKDRKADLLLGHEDGRVWMLISRCARDKWSFAKPVELLDGGKPLHGGRRPYPSVVDWNKDGKRDLLCHSADGQVFWFENKGSDAEPVFDGRQVVETEFSPIYGGYRSRLTVADWNHDGKPDLIYGVTWNEDRKGYLYVFTAE